MRTLQSLNSEFRSIVVEGLHELSKPQSDALKQLRAHVNDDAKLFYSLAMHNSVEGCTFKESVGSLLKFFNSMNQQDGSNKGGLVSVKFDQSGQILVGNKYMFTLAQVNKFEESHVQVIKNGLLLLNG